MKVNVYDLTPKVISEITLTKSVFDTEVKQALIAQAIRTYQANQRSSHAKTKTRAEVAGTTQKVWSQKGTGRARHGSRKAPIFVGGGVVHGPKGNRNYKISLSQKQRQIVLKSILTSFAKEKRILVIDQLSKIEPKTKVAWKLIDQFENLDKNLNQSKKIGLVTSQSSSNIKRAFSNISGFTLLSLSSLNAYNLASQNYLIFTKKAIEALNKLK